MIRARFCCALCPRELGDGDGGGSAWRHLRGLPAPDITSGYVAPSTRKQQQLRLVSCLGGPGTFHARAPPVLERRHDSRSQGFPCWRAIERRHESMRFFFFFFFFCGNIVWPMWRLVRTTSRPPSSSETSDSVALLLFDYRQAMEFRWTVLGHLDYDRTGPVLDEESHEYQTNELP
ncbi:hypothetical protein AXG93_4284s1150 [Marchantia polymorpha subsp. ruderalis]|uniref:Uncharacterized protein n=1 Tax=Marchantia polymorpha subsp. ruderalis TaxID=1480154 RepID=A0A176VTT2_MARPO|nr:hypothetical protein AXG93_4284s1150 [Marchantia polymorpha subsp. ruderalis]